MDRETYTMCYLNGKKHIELAKRLGTEKDFGTAISFFVLGIEELIKYLVIQNSSADNKLFTEKEINSLFGSHSIKHKIIIEFLESTKHGFAEKFALTTLNKINNVPLTDDLKAVHENRFKEFGSMVGITEKHLTEEEIDSFILWLDKKADNYKNKGLYVDRENKSVPLSESKLVSPTQIEENDFKIVLKFADSFLKQVTLSKNLDTMAAEFMKMLNNNLET